MLSFILRLAFEFEREHGMRPNQLYLNAEHLERLRGEFDAAEIRHIERLLDMDINITPDAVHPSVARVPAAAELKAAG